MITWEEIHADVLEHGGVSLSQGVCQNIAASLNSRIRLEDIEYANGVSERAAEATIVGIQRDKVETPEQMKRRTLMADREAARTPGERAKAAAKEW